MKFPKDLPRIHPTHPTALLRATKALGLGLGLLGALCAREASAASALPLYESFSTSIYTGDGNLGAVATIWDFGNSASGSSAKVAAAAALSYPGLITEDVSVSRGLRSNPAGTGTKNRGASLTVPAGAPLYTSFLLNLQTVTNATRPFFGFSTSSSGGSVSLNGAVIYLDAQGRLLLAKNSSTPAAATTYSLTTNITYLVVLRYKFNPNTANDDVVDLWLDPTFLGNDSQIPPPTLSLTNGTDLSSIGSIAYFQNSSYPPLFSLDEIHVATNWAAVTPPTNAPGTLYSVTGGGLVCSGGGTVVGLSGSDSGVTYLLYTNGAFSGQTMDGNGSALSFGVQTATANYTVLGSNTATLYQGWMHGNANVAAPAPAAIVTPPLSIVVATNGLGVFNVIATGDGLGYQWRRNGLPLSDGGNISGSASSNLVISPAGPSDTATTANGYDVVITNLCGISITSPRVGLALDKPSNLVWSGDGVTNLWDVGASTNWNAQTAVFNSGDNVTFDDTATGFNVFLGSSYLSPNAWVVNSSASYGFGGGSIVGPCSLVKAGTGTLTISNANTYTGGTVISNGVIALGSNAANNSGSGSGVGATNAPVTFYGGTLLLFGYNGSQSPNYATFRNPLVVPAGQSGTLGLFSRGPANSGANSGLASSLTGSGTLNLVVNYVRDNLDGDWSAFTGLINVTAKSGSSDEMRINNSFGYANAAVYLNDGVTLDRVTTTNATIDIGELGGTSLAVIGPGNSSAINPTWRVGWKNTTNTFAGTINNDGVTSIVKVGAGKWILTGGNNYSGSTIVSNGVLALGDGVADGSINSSANLLLAPGTVLDVSGRSDHSLSLSSAQTLQGSGTVLGSVDASGGGVVIPGSPVGALTVTNTATLAGTTMLSLNRNATPSSGRLVAANLVYGGELVVTNVGSTLRAGDAFELFAWSASRSGSFSSVVLPTNYYTWDTTQLEVNGTIRVAALSPLPQISNLSLDTAGNLTLSGVKGAPSTSFSVLTTTNLATPTAAWSTLGSGSFQADGTFSFTATVDPSQPQQYFMLQPAP